MPKPRKRLLVVEDDPVIARLYRFMFEAKHAVTVARDLTDARAALAAADAPPDLLVLDIGLPDGSGLEFCEEVKAAHPGRPVIVISADQFAGREAARRGAVFLPKPMDPDYVDALVSSLLASLPVLVVADHADLAQLLTVTVSNDGYDVVAMSSAGEARKLLSMPSAVFTAAIIEQVLPDARGSDLAAELKAAWPFCAMILLADLQRPPGAPERRRVPRPEPDFVLMKPLDLDRLVALLPAHQPPRAA